MPAAQAKSIDAEGRVVEKAVWKALKERQEAMLRLVAAVQNYKRISTHPESILGSEYAQALIALGNALDDAERVLE